MVKMIKPQRRSFGAFKSFIEEELPKIKGNPKVWNAFLKRSGNSANSTLAEEVLQFGTDPMLFVADLNKSYGFFHPDKPNTINIGKQLVQKFQKNSGDQKMRQIIEATILHELVHWSCNKRGIPEEENGLKIEMGVKFEEEAYGIKVLQDGQLMHASQEKLGTLSRRYESRGNPAAIGWDSNGGYSFGDYQLASSKGRVGDFMRYLDQSGIAAWNHFADVLGQAGGDAAARAGTSEFKNAWRELATDSSFSDAQHSFIKVTHYDIFDRKLRVTGFNLDRHSKALRDVAWSVSVQHGPGAIGIFTIPINRLDPSRREDDAAIINAVYDERSNVDKYFRKSVPNIKQAVKERFKKERQDALNALTA